MRFRLTPRQLLLSVLAPVVLLVLFSLVATAGLRALLVGAAFGSVLIGLLRVRAGLDLRDDGAVVRGLVGSVVVPWTDVRGVEVSQRGTRRILVIETEARLFRPIAPATSKGLADPAFESKARRISDFWRSHR